MVTDFAEKNKIVAFSDRLCKRARSVDSWLCVGIDPDAARLPEGVSRDAQGVVEFVRRIVEATYPYAAAIKLQFAFFEALGSQGWEALGRAREAIPDEILVIADAKRGDIANTAKAYASGVFDELGFDAITVNPYLGWESLEPFLEYPSRAAFVLCRTSNPGAADLQELEAEGEKLYMRVAHSALRMNGAGEVALVVGATAQEALRAVRGLSEEIVLLVPGVGTQGGRLEEALTLASNRRGERALINVSREILFASSGRDYAEAATASVKSIVEAMRTVRDSG